MKNMYVIDRLVTSASYLDLHLEFSNEGRLRTKLYDKRDDFICLLIENHLYVATFQ